MTDRDIQILQPYGKIQTVACEDYHLSLAEDPSQRAVFEERMRVQLLTQFAKMMDPFITYRISISSLIYKGRMEMHGRTAFGYRMEGTIQPIRLIGQAIEEEK